MNAHTRPDPLADRYSVRSYGSRDMAMVFDNQRHVPFAGPCSWDAAVALAAHMEAVHKRSRQQNEAGPVPDDFPEYERSASQADRECQFSKEQF